MLVASWSGIAMALGAVAGHAVGGEGRLAHGD